MVKKIKRQLTGSIKNLNENNLELIETNCILNKNKITYNKDNIIHNIYVKDNYIVVKRENETFSQQMIFSKNKKNLSSYLLKENNFNIDIELENIDNKVEYENNLIKRIYIKYKVCETKVIYEYELNIGGK